MAVPAHPWTWQALRTDQVVRSGTLRKKSTSSIRLAFDHFKKMAEPKRFVYILKSLLTEHEYYVG